MEPQTFTRVSLRTGEGSTDESHRRDPAKPLLPRPVTFVVVGVRPTLRWPETGAGSACLVPGWVSTRVGDSMREGDLVKERGSVGGGAW